MPICKYINIYIYIYYIYIYYVIYTINYLYMQYIYIMINFADATNENKTEHSIKWSYIPDYPCRILIIRGSGSRKANSLLNLINHQSDTDKIYLYAKDPYEAK